MTRNIPNLHLFRACALVVPLLLVIGCSKGGDKPSRPDPSHGWLVAEIRAEIARQFRRVGADPAIANRVRINVKRCPETGSNSDGSYSCDKRCTRVGQCVHAWNQSGKGRLETTFLFTGHFGDPGKWLRKNKKTLRHEVVHFTTIFHAGSAAYGHPEFVTIRGKRWRCRDIGGGIRWPAVVRGVQQRLGFEDPWQKFMDVTLDMDGNVNDGSQP